MYDDASFDSLFYRPFLARVTGVSPGSTPFSGNFVYTWFEQTFDGDGNTVDLTGGRSGTATLSPALEVSDQQITTFPFYAWMRYRTMVEGMPVYEFVNVPQPGTVIQPIGPAPLAGLTGQYAASGHVHPFTTLTWDLTVRSNAEISWLPDDEWPSGIPAIQVQTNGSNQFILKHRRNSDTGPSATPYGRLVLPVVGTVTPSYTGGHQGEILVSDNGSGGVWWSDGALWYKLADADDTITVDDIGVTVQEQDTFLQYIADLLDPGADRLLFFDDSTGEIAFLTVGANLSISGTTISATGAVADANYGAITVSSSGTVWTINSGVVTEAMQVLADNTTNNASTTKHGYLKKLSNTATEFMNGQGNWATPAGGVADANYGAITVSSSGTVWTINASVVTEAMQTLADNSTNNASTTKHGYLKKLSNTATEYMDGQGNWSTPTGSVADGSITFAKMQAVSTQVLLGNDTTGSTVQEITPGNMLAIDGLAALNVTAATQAQQETGSATNVAVTPGRQHFHTSAAKAWVDFNGTGTPAIEASYNVDSITDNATGDYTVNWATDFSSANYAAAAMCGGAGSSGVCFAGGYHITPQAAGSYRIRTIDFNSAADMPHIHVVAFGDHT